MEIRCDLKKQLLEEILTLSPNDAAGMIEIYYNTLDEISKEFHGNWTYCANCCKYVKNTPELVYNMQGRTKDYRCPECGGLWMIEVLG